MNEDQNKYKGDKENTEEEIDLDILRNVENLSSQVNEAMALRSKTVLQRYPLTFALLTLFGVVAVNEGVKGILESFGFTDHSWYLFIAGLVVLIFTGTLYKKLNK